MGGVSCLQVTSGSPSRHRLESLLPACLPGTKAPSPACLSTAFSGDCELPAGSTLISVPAETQHACPEASLLGGEPHLTFVRATFMGAGFPHSVLLVLVLFLYNYPDSFVVKSSLIRHCGFTGECYEDKGVTLVYLKLLILWMLPISVLVNWN